MRKRPLFVSFSFFVEGAWRYTDRDYRHSEHTATRIQTKLNPSVNKSSLSLSPSLSFLLFILNLFRSSFSTHDTHVKLITLPEPTLHSPWLKLKVKSSIGMLSSSGLLLLAVTASFFATVTADSEHLRGKCDHQWPIDLISVRLPLSFDRDAFQILVTTGCRRMLSWTVREWNEYLFYVRNLERSRARQQYYRLFSQRIQWKYRCHLDNASARPSRNHRQRNV